MLNQGNILSHLKEYATTLTIYEYAGFAIAFVLFLLFFFMAISMRKQLVQAALLVLLSFIVIGIAPVTVKFVSNEYFKTTDISLARNQKLRYVDTVIVAGKLTNTSSLQYKKCIVTVRLIKRAGNPLEKISNVLKPLRRAYKLYDTSLPPGESLPFKIVIDRFTHSSAFKSLVTAECW